MENRQKALSVFKQPKTLSEFCEQDAWLLQRITTVEQITRGPVLDAIGKAKMTELWRGTLNEIGPEAFDEALKHVIMCSAFHPTISEIRKAAGINRGIQDPTEKKALSELGFILGIMRLHGPEIKPIHGKLLKDRDEDGRILPRSKWEFAPETPTPRLDTQTEAALCQMGMGSREGGLELIACHPALPWNSSKDDAEARKFKVRNAAEIEKRWIESWRAA